MPIGLVLIGAITHLTLILLLIMTDMRVIQIMKIVSKYFNELVKVKFVSENVAAGVILEGAIKAVVNRLSHSSTPAIQIRVVFMIIVDLVGVKSVVNVRQQTRMVVNVGDLTPNLRWNVVKATTESKMRPA